MPNINELPTATTLSSSDQLPIYSAANGDARKTSLSSLLTWIQSVWANPQYATTITTPADGFTIVLPDESGNQWALVRPTEAIATGAFTLPASTTAADGQEIKFTTTVTVTALTINLNGATAVNGVPATLTAASPLTIRYNSTTTTWYKV